MAPASGADVFDAAERQGKVAAMQMERSFRGLSDLFRNAPLVDFVHAGLWHRTGRCDRKIGRPSTKKPPKFPPAASVDPSADRLFARFHDSDVFGRIGLKLRLALSAAKADFGALVGHDDRISHATESFAGDRACGQRIAVGGGGGAGGRVIIAGSEQDDRESGNGQSGEKK